MFCFSRANQANTNLKKLLSQKLDKFNLLTHSPRRLRLGKSLQNMLFALADVLSEKNPYFGKHNYSQLVRISL